MKTDINLKPPVLAGVAVFLYNEQGQFLLMQRRGSHGAGTWGLPGGHIDFGEQAAVAAQRELQEELGITLHGFHHMGWSEAVFAEDNKHYITVLFATQLPESMKVTICEPHKCDALMWADGLEIEFPDPLFPPLGNYITRYGIPHFPLLLQTLTHNNTTFLSRK